MRNGQYIEFLHGDQLCAGWIVDNRANKKFSTYKVKLNKFSREILDKEFHEVADCEIVTPVRKY